jgi:hypothetical protein
MEQLTIFDFCRLEEKIPNLHPVYGYDVNKVPAVKCLYCNDFIGSEEFIEIEIFARFGQMLFAHKRCDENAGS